MKRIRKGIKWLRPTISTACEIDTICAFSTDFNVAVKDGESLEDEVHLWDEAADQDFLDFANELRNTPED